MTDRFDIQREHDNAAGENAGAAMDRLDACQDKRAERDERLIRLDDAHYFDPLNKEILFKDLGGGGEFRNLGHNQVYMKKAADFMEAEARRDGYLPVQGGLFWHPVEKRLFVKSGDHYVLFALDRRDDPDAV